MIEHHVHHRTKRDDRTQHEIRLCREKVCVLFFFVDVRGREFSNRFRSVEEVVDGFEYLLFECLSVSVFESDIDIVRTFS